jgi:hypothetical protein
VVTERAVAIVSVLMLDCRDGLEISKIPGLGIPVRATWGLEFDIDLELVTVVSGRGP